MFKHIARELREHSPFTAIGALTGIVLMLALYKIPYSLSYKIFYTLHPLHVFLSAFVTTSMYLLHTEGEKKKKILAILLIGYFGSVGIGTLSDSVVPFLGETLLNLPNKGIHLGFIEEWWLVNPLALLGILIAYFRPTTKFPHAGHVLVSTWASTFHVIMALGGFRVWYEYLVLFVFLFLAVWVPCCTSDIVFPLMFVKLRVKDTRS